MATYDYEAEPIFPIKQGEYASLCWAAATAVMLGWRNRSRCSLQDAANFLGVEFVEKYAAGSPLKYGDVPLWKERGGFVAQGQQCIDAAGWNDLLRKHGPLITLISANATKRIDHVVVVTGILGDGSGAGTVLKFADGQCGCIRKYSLIEFATVFEVPDGADTLFSVMYFE